MGAGQSHLTLSALMEQHFNFEKNAPKLNKLSQSQGKTRQHGDLHKGKVATSPTSLELQKIEQEHKVVLKRITVAKFF